MAETVRRGGEAQRLVEDEARRKNWKRWGPYLSARQWGTVREDYSPNGDAWNYFPHEHARSRAYRWGEDGLLGICDRQGRMCFALALWNGADPILKERLFGLTGPEGNHGEDVKECFYYLDATPTHSYMRALYKYPQRAFPYAELVAENGRRSRSEREYELGDTGAFDESRYFDVFVEYAKAGPDDILIEITCANRGPQTALLHVLPTLWFRNTWSWDCTQEGCDVRPSLRAVSATEITAEEPSLGRYRFAVEAGTPGFEELLFTENETNVRRVFGTENECAHVKDAFHECLIGGRREAVNPKRRGTKAAAHLRFEIEAGGSRTVRLRLAAKDEAPMQLFGAGFTRTMRLRREECDAFYDARLSAALPDRERAIARQAYAGLVWSKQFYHYVVEAWLAGDPGQPAVSPARKKGRNSDWLHLYNRDVISMPDDWEYPWYAAWDLAFHAIPFARIDPSFAKQQLELFLREWYMHPNGEIPAYEWALSDVNPPVHAWACWRVYKKCGPHGQRDRRFLASAFQKLVINFTWWVNRKDSHGKHIFSGGFLGLDNIGVFDRSKPLPTGGSLEQADGTAWMAFYCGTMLSIALELAAHDRVYEDMASKFFEHFVHIVDAMNRLGGTGLWNEEDGFYYDQITLEGRTIPLRVRSMVGLIPLIAVEVIDRDTLAKLPDFQKRTRWFLENRKDLAQHVSYMERSTAQERYMLAIPSRERLERVLRYMLDEDEFLSPYGIRALSRYHAEHPYVLHIDGTEHRVDYTPGESTTSLFGGNSNWRGPIWFPVNFLLIEALERYHHFYGDDFTVEFPTGSGVRMNLGEVARELSLRLSRLFVPDASGRRPAHGDDLRYRDDPHWKELVLFYEYFHGDDGRGCGASHQTGWTALVANLLESSCSSDGDGPSSKRARPRAKSGRTKKAPTKPKRANAKAPTRSRRRS
ncbi:MAG: MGH1-like glycoside hydrolase domain-containing protein [Planctomycetota bacterium]